MNDLTTQINDLLWSYVLVAALVACGLWCTWRTKGVQFRMIGEMFRLLTDTVSSATPADRHRASSAASTASPTSAPSWYP